MAGKKKPEIPAQEKEMDPQMLQYGKPDPEDLQEGMQNPAPAAENDGAQQDAMEFRRMVAARESERRQQDAEAGAAGITGFEQYAPDPMDMIGLTGPIDKESIREAEEILQKYAKGKEMLRTRVIEDEEWWKLRHWRTMRNKSHSEGDIEPVSAWLFNSIINKHADFMDNFPEANVLPREESDKATAKVLSDIVPVIFEENKFQRSYDRASYDKLKFGFAVYGNFWDARKQHGIGDIAIKQIDPLKIFWEPGVEDIQESANIFLISLEDSKTLQQMYPHLKEQLRPGADGIAESAKYIYEDEVDTSDKTVVVDWYYKKQIRVPGDGMNMPMIKTVLHYVKFSQGELLYASENDPNYAEKGWYWDGRYPFVFDVMFPEKGTAAGFGYIDIMRDPQMYIDKLQQAILKNAYIGSKPRALSKDGGGINEAEFTDLEKDVVHYTGNPADIMWAPTPQLPGIYVEVLNNKISELKETSGNRDFSQGSTTSGVTAASAIAALQEAGSKLSRDMIKGTYDAFEDLTYMTIERMRQFYTIPRTYRITGKNGYEFIQIDAAILQSGPEEDNFGVITGGRAPYFDITVSAQKASPFTKLAQNEFAKELYASGFFNPQFADQALMALDMMTFDGKEELMQKIQQNGTMYEQLQQMQAAMLQMSSVISQATGDTRLEDALSGNDITGGAQAPVGNAPASGEAGGTVTDSLGNVKKTAGDNSRAAQARAKVARSTTIA